MDNLKDAKILHKKAFCDSDDNIELFFSAKYHKDWHYYTSIDGKLVSQIFVIPYDYQFFCKKITVPFLAGVATDPDYRYRGLCNALIKQTLQNLYDKGYAFCLLSPFDVEFYRKTSFEVVNFCDSHAVPAAINTPPHGYSIQKALPTDVPILKMIYDKNTFGYSFHKIRTEADWLFIVDDISDEGCAYIIYFKNQPIGYALVSKNVILEYVIPSLEVLSYFPCLQGKVAVKLDSHGLDYAMMRIVHLENFLKMLPFKIDVDYTFSFEYTDSEIPNNNGVWTIKSRIGYPLSVSREHKVPSFALDSKQVVSHFWNEGAPLNPYLKTSLYHIMLFSYEKY